MHAAKGPQDHPHIKASLRTNPILYGTTRLPLPCRTKKQKPKFKRRDTLRHDQVVAPMAKKDGEGKTQSCQSGTCAIL